MNPERITAKEECDWLYLAHRWAGLAVVPFLLISIMLALGLTHTQWLNALSDKIFPSLPIPSVRLDEPVQPGSWDQALKLAKLAVGKTAHVITPRSDNVVVLSAFMERTHDLAVAKSNPHLKVQIDMRSMEIVRIEDNSTSLVNKAHGFHAIQFFGIRGFSISIVSALSLLILLFSGGLLAWRDRKNKKQYEKLSSLHVRAGQVIGLFIIVIVLTTLDFEFSFFGRNADTTSHPVPDVQLPEPLHPGSVDQARELVRLATGVLPRGVFIRGNGDDVKFSEAGDGIGGKSVWMNINTMTINRITDWRNDKQTIGFILHDGRWLGGMNAFNINDAIALVLLFVVLSGSLITACKRSDATGSNRGAGCAGAEPGIKEDRQPDD